MPSYPALLDPAVDSFKVQRETINSLIGAIATLEAAGVVAHNQDWSTITTTPTTLAGYGIVDSFDGAYGSLTGTPATFTPAVHVHDASDITTGTIQPAQISNTAVTPGTYTVSTLTIDQQGRITAASNGSAGTMSSFAVRDDAGVDWIMAHGEFLQLTSGAGTGGAATDLSITKGTGDGSTGTPYLVDFKIEAAPKWTNSRSVTFSGSDVTGTFSMDGSVDISAIALSFDLAATPTWTADHTHSADLIMSGVGAVAHSTNYYGTAALTTELDSAPVGAIYYEHEV